jgi:hypothetical protein
VSSTLLALVLLVVALACPAHMLWLTRRGKQAACCVPAGHDELGELRARQRALGDELARRAEADVAPPGGHRVAGKPG